MDERTQVLREDAGTSVPIYGAPAAPIDSLIVFEKNSRTLRDDAKETLRALNEQVAGADCIVSLEGHADEFEDFPEELSKKRAEAARTALIAMGMKKSRLKVVARGHSQQVDRSVHTLLLNRRVEFKWLALDGGPCERPQ